MTNSANISARIEALATESAAHGDLEMAELCERAAGSVLIDSRTGDTVTPEELFGDELPVPAYVRAICESLDSGTAEGHILASGRKVYAA